MALKVGLHAGQQDIELDELRRLWRFADEHGFDFLSCWDHFYEAPPRDGTAPTYEPISLMAAMAVETQNVRLGCHVFCMNYRNPTLLAKSIATIDHLSHGRVEVGLGSGWHTQEHAAYGYDFPPTKERLDRLEEGVQIIKGMFSQERTSFDGRYYRAADAMLWPRPVQDPIPVVIGGRGEKRTLRIAARYAQGWNVPYIHLEEFARLNGVLDHWCEVEGRDPREVERSINLHMMMGTNERDAERVKREHAGSLRTPQQLGGAVTGTPQQAIETLKTFEQSGAYRVSVAIRPPVEWDALQAFVEEVMPAVKRG